MFLTIKFVPCFLTLLVAANAVQIFPHGKTLVYKYHLDAKAGAIEPAAYASQFALEGLLHVRHDTSDPKLKNAYYVLLADVKTGIHNGIAVYNRRVEAHAPIDEAARIIQQPFLIVYDDNGRFQGVKIPKTEAGWSRNMKMAMASMLQLDLNNMNLDETPLKDHSFISNEKTIHGDCSIIYDVHPKNDSTTDEFVVTKFLSPMNCTGFAVQSFNHVDIEGCQDEKKEPMTVDSRRIFEAERRGDDVLIKKLVALGGVNYLPWKSEAEFHYVLTNATFELQPVVSVREVDFPASNFRNLPLIRDVTYRRPHGNYVKNAAEDVTQGRHVVKPEVNAGKLMEVLGKAADYIEENHLKMSAPEWREGQTLNRILRLTSYLDIESIRRVFDTYGSTENPRDMTIKKILIGVMPQVGTAATSLFTLEMIRDRKVADYTAIEILTKLPLTVKVPAESLLTRMEDLARLNDSVSAEVRKAGVLCFSSLVYRTFKDVAHPEKSDLFNRYLRDFLERVKNEPTYEMKILYLMAIKNVRVGRIHELLGPIIRGESAISEDPVEIRHLAIWAIDKAVENDYRVASNLLWPVMSDRDLPVKLRIAAYEILMHQARSQADVFQMRRFMSAETNGHLYHYHYTTVHNIIKSVDPCRVHLRELVTKIMRNAKPRDNIRHVLSSVYAFDYKIEKYNYLEKLQAGVIVNEVTGVPDVVQIDNVVTDGREAISDITIRLHVQGCDELINLLLHGDYIRPGVALSPKVLEILKRASTTTYPKDIRVDVVLLHMGRVILANHYNHRTLKTLYEDTKNFVHQHLTDFHLNSQHVIYVHLSEKQVISDLGLPVIMESRLPVAASLKLKYNKVPESQPRSMDLGLDLKLWSHGDYAMSIYNPLVDVWHAIRRPTAIDVSVPIRVIVNWDAATRNLRLSFRRLSASRPPVAGVRMYIKDVVTVDADDDDEALKTSCPTCEHARDVSLGKLDVIGSNFDSASSGLEYSMNIFDCESGASPITLSSDWYRAVMSERNDTWIDWYVNDKVTMRQELNNMLRGSMGSLGILLKAEPSAVYSTSRVDVSLRVSFADGTDTGTSFNPLGHKRLEIRGTVDAIAAATNSSARMWSLSANIDVNQGHTMNMAMAQVIRKTRGEKNLKICLVARKTYADPPADFLKMNASSREVVFSNITIAAAYSDGEACSYNGTLVTVTTRAELSDEQKKRQSHDLETGACTQDVRNPLYANPENTVPRTLNCLAEAIRYTTLRKYTVNVVHQNVPEGIADAIFIAQYIIRDHKLPNVKYVDDRLEAKKIRIKARLPVRKNVVDLSVVLPKGSYDAMDIPIEIPILKSLGPTIKSAWYWPLENSRFGLEDLIKYTWDAMRLCSIYPQVVITADGSSVPFNITEQWTLISGDHVDRRFAVFAKKLGNNLAAKVYMENYEVEIAPDASNEFHVTFDGRPVSPFVDDVVIPADSENWALKLTKENLHISVQMKNVPLTIVHGVNHLVLAIDTKLQGRVSGLCGHLDGSYLTRIPENYTTLDL